jgi:hypothetical protein
MFGWWDDFELWLTGLPFALQFALVMIVLVPLAAAVAFGVDRLFDVLSAHIRDRRSDLDS